jgi:hypothetical protein
VSKVIYEPVLVHINKNSRMTAFIWRRRLYHVLGILCWWREPSAWWCGEPVRLLLRVNAENVQKGVYELCRIGSDWFISRLHD